MTSLGMARRSPGRKERRDKDHAKRAVANLLYVAGHSHSFIAAILNLSQGRVCQLLNTSEWYQPDPLRV